MMLCAMWGVRGSGGAAPAYHEFINRLNYGENAEPTKLLNCCWPMGGGPMCGRPRYYETDSWDPVYFLDRTVGMLFFSSACLVYLTQGLLYAIIVSCGYAMYIRRLGAHGSRLFFAATEALRS